MNKMLALVGLLFCTTLQAASKAATELVVPTEMAVSPELFVRGQVVSVKASFKQLTLVCGPGATHGFEVRLYDEVTRAANRCTRRAKRQSTSQGRLRPSL